MRKSILTIVSGALLLIGCQVSPQGEQADSPRSTQSTAQADQQRAVLTIEGMACPFCTYNIQRQLEEVEGVERADVSLEKSEAYVRLSKHTPPTAKELREAVESAGFTPTEVTMP